MSLERELCLNPIGHLDIDNIWYHLWSWSSCGTYSSRSPGFGLVLRLCPSLSGPGRSPSSTSLAAYGESLVLERKPREQKEQRESTWKDVESHNAAKLVLSPLTALYWSLRMVWIDNRVLKISQVLKESEDIRILTDSDLRWLTEVCWKIF